MAEDFDWPPVADRYELLEACGCLSTLLDRAGPRAFAQTCSCWEDGIGAGDTKRLALALFVGSHHLHALSL